LAADFSHFGTRSYLAKVAYDWLRQKMLELDFCARVEDSSSSPRVIEYARKAAQEALDGAYSSCSGLRNINPRACGVVVGTAGGVRTEWDLSGRPSIQSIHNRTWKGSISRNCRDLARVTGFAGPCATVNTACTSGATACGVAFEWIRQGIVELALVCGADEFTEYSAMGFELIGAYAQGHAHRWRDRKDFH